MVHKESQIIEQIHDKKLELGSNLRDLFNHTTTFKEPTRCIKCEALYVNKKWSWYWGQTPPHTYVGKCPACKRIEEKKPAGILTLSGPVYIYYRMEIMNFIRQIEQVEIHSDPMQRILGITRTEEQAKLTTTGRRILRRIDNSLERIYKGETEISGRDEMCILQMKWFSPDYHH